MDSLLDLDHSELESHLFTHLSEIGRRDDAVSEATEEDVDIEEYQNQVTKNARNSKRNLGKRSATKTGTLVGAEVGTRSRPRKQHEPVPFLSIDNMPRSKRQQLQPLQPIDATAAARQVSFISNPNVPYNTPSRNSFRQIASRTSTAPTMSGASTEWNSMVPKRHRGKGREEETPHVNLMVQAPFKHSVTNTPRIRRAPSPSNVLKEKTNQATYQVAKLIAKQKRPKTQPPGTGRLLKAKLKPMYPVDVQGPSIDKCRGIRPEPKRVDMSKSNTVQRRRIIMNALNSDMAVANNEEDFPERPHTTESVHQTSIASDLSENRLLDIKDELEEVEKFRKDRTIPMDAMLRMPPNSVASLNGNRTQFRENGLPRTPQKSETTSVLKEHSDIDSVTLATETPARSVPDSGPYSVGEVPDDLRNDDLPCTSEPPSVKSASSKRPKTAAESEGRKVRFADEKGSRSQSATARLRTPTSAKSPSNLKADVLKVEASANQSITEETTVSKSLVSTASGNATKREEDSSSSDVKQKMNVNSDSVNTARGDVEKQLEDCDDGNVNNNNLEASNKQALKMKLGYMEFIKPRRIKSAPVRRVRPGSSQFPRHKPFTWGESNKPDAENVEDLNICGKSTEYNNDMALIEFYGEKSAADITFKPGRTCGKAARPLSATGSRMNSGYLIEATKQLVKKARPLSAQLFSSVEDFDGVIESRGAIISERDSTVAALNSNRSVVAPMITYQIPPKALTRKLRRRYRRTEDGERQQLHLADLVQHAKARVCTECGEGAFCYADLEEGVVCENCALDGSTISSSSSDDEDQDIPNYSARADDGLCDYEEGEYQLPEENAELQEALFNDLENSLANIQSQIGRCIKSGNERGQTSPFQTPRFLEDVLELHDHEHVTMQNNARDVIEKSLLKDTDPTQIKNRDSTPAGFISKKIANSSEITDEIDNKIVTIEENKTSKEQGLFVENGNETNSGNTEEICLALAVIDEESTLRSEGERFEDEEKGEVVSMATREQNGLHVKARKTTIRPRSAGETVAPICPYPPLCFRLNARPPPGYCYYFAYGTDMNPHRFSTYIKRENVDRFWGLLFGFKLRFNRKCEDKEAGCFPNVEYCQSCSVEGAVYAIKSQELALVDQCMGYPQYVEKIILPVWFANCAEPDELGVAQYCVAAVTYIAKDEWTVEDCSDVANEYAVSQCIKSADLLSPAYKEYLISQVN